MTFSESVKKELAAIVPQEEHCIRAQAEARKYFTLVRKAYTIESDILKRRCCRRAFLREAFIVSGTMSDPSKSYHFELYCNSLEKAEFVRDLIAGFERMEPRTARRGGRWIVYIKDSDQIVDMLGIMGASQAFLDIENIRILKEMRGDINRRVNFETANLSKTVSAAMKQTEDIRLIRDTVGLDRLPDGLREIAAARLRLPEASLTELGAVLDPPLGKSGVSHRLSRISRFAEDLRKQQL